MTLLRFLRETESRIVTCLSVAPLIAVLTGCPNPQPTTVGTNSSNTLMSSLHTSVLTQRYNNGRTGANSQEQVLTVGAVSSSQFQQLYTINVPGQVYAQPLLASQVKFSDGSVNDILIVATMTNNIMALLVDDAVSGAFVTSNGPKVLWSTRLPGFPVPANFMPMGYSTVGVYNGCPGSVAGPPTTIPPLPAIGSEPSQIDNSTGWYNLNPLIGVLSTPVIDPNAGRVYVVSESQPGTGLPASVVNTLFLLDLHTGTILNQTVIGMLPGTSDRVATVAGTSSDNVNGFISFSQQQQMQRPALLLQNGHLYIAFGSHQDTPPWHGWIFEYDATTLNLTAFWTATPNALGGSIWQAGSGIVGDGTNIYVMTGNGEIDPPNNVDPSDAQSNFSNMFLQLQSSGSRFLVLGRYIPNDVGFMNNWDVDLGASGPMLLPGTTMLVGGDKESRLFVLDTSTNLGMRQEFQAGAGQDWLHCGGSGYHHIHGTPVAWVQPSGDMNIYIWPERDSLRSFLWDHTSGTLQCLNSSNQQEKCVDGDQPMRMSSFSAPGGTESMPGGIISVSSVPDDPVSGFAGSGVVWASVPKKDDALAAVVQGDLYAFNAANIANKIWDSEWNAARDGNFMFAKYNPPMVANGRVYLPTAGSVSQVLTGSINVYGLVEWGKLLVQTGDPWISSSVYGAPTAKRGAKFKATWIFHNVGTTTWKANTVSLVPTATDLNVWGSNSVALPNDVNPGQEVSIQATLTAPTSLVSGCSPAASTIGMLGSCYYQWQLIDASISGGSLTISEPTVLMYLNLQ